MKLIVGLGNPEGRYKNTRHNVGFSVLSAFAASKGADFTEKSKFRAMVAELDREGERVLLALPLTYYNNSGESVRALKDFYKLSTEDIVVIHDELALPFGAIRTRIGSSDAGNNGIKSVNSHAGNETARVRVGIYNELREKMDDAAFVLAGFSAKEQAEFEKSLLPKVFEILEDFITGSFVPTTHK